PMLAAIGAAELLLPQRAAPRATLKGAVRRRAAVAAAMLVVGFAAALGIQGWRVEAQGSIASRDSLQVERTAAAATALTPAGSPVVVVLGGPGDRGIAKAETLIRTALPPPRVADVRFFVGSPADLVAGRVRATGPVERDRIARLHWVAIRPLMHDRPLVLAVAHPGRPVAGWQPLGHRIFQ